MVTTFNDQSLKSFFAPKKLAACWGLAPLYGMMAFAVGGAIYFAVHTAGGPEIAWTREERSKPAYGGYSNNSLQREQTSKIYNPNGRFSERWNKFIN